VEPSLNDAPCGFATISDESIIVYANSKFLEIIGRSDAGAVLGTRLEEHLSISAKIFYQTHFFPLLKLHGEVAEIFMTLRSASGDSVPVIVNAVRRERGGRCCNDCVFTIVRERQKYEAELLAAKQAAEEALRSNRDLLQIKTELEQHTRELDRQIVQLRQRNRELHRISQILFHDLREPLRKLLSFSELLRAEPLTGSSDQFARRIESAAQRMDRLLRAVQEYVSIEALTRSAIANLDLNNIVNNAARQATESCHAEIEMEIEALPSLEGDERQLTLLFFHLLNNAIKFRRPHTPPRVAIGCTVTKQNVFVALAGHYQYLEFARITFTDNSSGFEVSDSETAFQLLSKNSKTTAGLGVGLAICRKIVDNHFGIIAVRPAARGGMEYTIQLPIKQNSLDADSPPRAQVAPTHST
jgi:phosphoserine phosphatase RsbU/P